MLEILHLPGRVLLQRLASFFDSKPEWSCYPSQPGISPGFNTGVLSILCAGMYFFLHTLRLNSGCGMEGKAIIFRCGSALWKIVCDMRYFWPLWVFVSSSRHRVQGKTDVLDSDIGPEKRIIFGSSESTPYQHMLLAPFSIWGTWGLGH